MTDGRVREGGCRGERARDMMATRILSITARPRERETTSQARERCVHKTRVADVPVGRAVRADLRR